MESMSNPVCVSCGCMTRDFVNTPNGPQCADHFTSGVVAAMLRARDEQLAACQQEVERLRALLTEIDQLERMATYERCPDCDHPKQCTRETGCLVVQRNGGTLVQQVVKRAFETAGVD